MLNKCSWYWTFHNSPQWILKWCCWYLTLARWYSCSEMMWQCRLEPARMWVILLLVRFQIKPPLHTGLHWVQCRNKTYAPSPSTSCSNDSAFPPSPHPPPPPPNGWTPPPPPPLFFWSKVVAFLQGQISLLTHAIGVGKGVLSPLSINFYVLLDYVWQLSLLVNKFQVCCALL